MTPFDVPIWSTLALGAGPWLFWRSMRDLRTRRLIQNTPSARIRSMPMGLVELSGQAVPRSELAAPFSGHPCAYWQVDVSRRTRDKGWAVIHRNASGHPFFLRDETGVAMVYPQGAEVRLNYGVEEECLGLSLPECYDQYLREQHVGLGAFGRMGTLRFRERTLEAGQTVYVLGTATPRTQSVAISMDGEELAATGTDDRRAQRVQNLDHEVRGVIRRGENERTYIISQQSERQLTLELGMRATAELVGGPVLALIGLAGWLHTIQAGLGHR